MASEAYKRMMKKIPIEIQRKVNFNLDIADEIYDTLEQRGQKAADLARIMDKSESEISKWLTGTHNFSIKTIQKIGLALDTELIMTKSAKIAEYEAEKIKLLAEFERLRNEREGIEVFRNSLLTKSFTIGNELMTFFPNKKDGSKLKPIPTSDYNVLHLVNN